MQDSPGRKSKTGAFLKLLLKIAVTIVCLWYVFKKINLNEILDIVRLANWWWLAGAFAIYSVSKLIGSRRLNIYFGNIGLALPEINNLKLYWLGMFYNLFLPGAVTGDAYKVILLSKKYGRPYKKLAAAVLLDRFSGLLSLGIIVAIYSSFVIREKTIVLLLLAGALAAIPVCWLVIKRFFKDFLPGFWPTFFWGALVQLSVLLCVYAIILALRVPGAASSYVFIFLIAAIASVLPISVGGGLGVREFVIIEGAKYTGLDQHTALIISLLFYLITVLCSLIGSIYVFRDPLKGAGAMPERAQYNEIYK